MLISTSDIRTWMGIPDGDQKPNAKLALIVQAILDFVDDYTNRKLEAKRYLLDPQFSYYDGTGKSYLYTVQSPVSYVSSVNVDQDRVFGASTIIDPTNYFYYPTGKIVLDRVSITNGFMQKGRRNILVDYTAGFAPVVGGTWNSSVSTYPVPANLKQVMIEMCVESFKEGITAVRTVQSNNQSGSPRFVQLLSSNSFWFNTLNQYKAYDAMLNDYDENQTRSKFDYNVWY